MGRRQKDSADPPKVRPLDVDGVRTVAIVTLGWGVAFVALALGQSQLNDAGNGWWLWTCLAGVGLGLLGLEYCRKRRDAIARAALDAEAEDGGFDDDSAVGDWSRLPPEEELGAVADEQPAPDEQPSPDDQHAPGEQLAPVSADHITQPYQHAEQAPGYSTGDMPVVPGRIGSPDNEYGQHLDPAQEESHTPPPAQADHEPEPQRPAEWPQPQPGPHPTTAPEQQPVQAAPLRSRRAAQHPGQPQQPDPVQQPPTPPPPPQAPPPQAPAAAPQAPPTPPQARPAAPQALPTPPQARPGPLQQPARPPVQQPSQHAPQPPSPRQAPPPQQTAPPQQPVQPESAPADPYSTDAGWYDSAAGYTPEADRARRHPRDRRPEPTQSSGTTESPAVEPERPARRPIEDSEFFGDDSSAAPLNSTGEFLLADLQGDDEQPPPTHHDRDAPSDQYRGRRARGSR